MAKQPYKLSQDELKELRGHFMRFSEDKQNITKEEGLRVVRLCGQNPSLKEYNTVLAQVNVYDKANLTFDEMQLLAQHLFKKENEAAVLEQAFKRLDKTGKGEIDKNDFKTYMMSHGEKLNQDEFNSLLAMAHVSHDGKIHYNELIRLFTRA